MNSHRIWVLESWKMLCCWIAEKRWIMMQIWWITVDTTVVWGSLYVYTYIICVGSGVELTGHCITRWLSALNCSKYNYRSYGCILATRCCYNVSDRKRQWRDVACHWFTTGWKAAKHCEHLLWQVLGSSFLPVYFADFVLLIYFESFFCYFNWLLFRIILIVR